MDPVVLSYQDSLLRRTDVALLDGPHWLSDRVIGFAFEYLSVERFSGLADSVCFIGPEVTQLIKCVGSVSELSASLQPLQLHTYSWLFLPVSDGWQHTGGGSHWSLLQFCRDPPRFSHYDSIRGGNASHARRVARHLQPLLDLTHHVPFVEEATPMQENSYDCGMYVICTAETLCQHKGTHSPNLTHTLTPTYITHKRAEWLQLIHTLAHK